MQRPFRTGDRTELTPDRFGRRGESEAEHAGWRVRIVGAIPGEAAEVEIEHVSSGGPVAVGRFLGPAGAPHPARREPPCAIHDECGGCGLQHIETGAALDLKVAQARRVLGADTRWNEPIAAPSALHYRAKTFLIPQARRGRLLLGARPPRGAALVDTTGCAVLRPELEGLSQRARAVLARRTDEEGHLRTVMLRCNRDGRTQLTLVHRGEAEWLAEAAAAIGADAAFLQRHDAPGNRIHSDRPEVQVQGRGPIRERFADAVDGLVPPTAFFQANPDVAEALYLLAAEGLGGGRVGELYCGAGVAGLLALHRRPDATLHGIDRSPRAIAAARANARASGLEERCSFQAGPAEETGADWDAVLVNPPRSGCHDAVLDAIDAGPARKLVYLSCNASTLARDVSRLGWRLDSVTPADMLPQTGHLELLAVLSR